MQKTQVNFGAAVIAAILSIACSPANSATRTDSSAPAAQQNPTASNTAATPPDPIVQAADRGRIDGDSTAKTWVIIASDFQCPFCKEWHDVTYKPFIDQYVRTGKVKVAYINFPLESIHKNAVITAEAAMCASSQNKFWQYHEALFSSQALWAGMPDPRPVLDSLAKAVGVDVAAWGKCVDSKQMLPLINADRDRAAAAGVGSTPSFLIGDQVLAGAQPLDDMRPAIEAAIAKSGSAPAR
ncbi:MAG: thioredoxin domain-containing protein [Gemmatimonadales bacterium]